MASAEKRIDYLILAETVEPIMIVHDRDPMAGGLMTDIVKRIFDGSDYVIEPKVLPWQRMKEEFRTSDNWIVHGFPASFDKSSQVELSEYPIFPFNHSAVTLKERGLLVRGLEDLHNQVLILVENFQYPVLDEYILASSDNPDANVGVIRAFSPGVSLNMLRHGRGDIVVDWQARIIYNLAAANLTIDDVEFHDATSIVPTENMHLAFSVRQSDEFRSFVNERIRALKESGELYELARKYYAPESPPDF